MDQRTDEPGSTPSLGETRGVPSGMESRSTEPAGTPAAMEEILTDRLEHVIDDTQGRSAAVEWTAAQLLAGATFEATAAELVTQGWEPASAESIVEEAREATRRQRGVRTRDDVVVGVYKKFTKTMRRVRWVIIIGVVIVIIGIGMLINRPR